MAVDQCMLKNQENLCRGCHAVACCTKQVTDGHSRKLTLEIPF